MPWKLFSSRRRSPLSSLVTLQTVYATNFPIVALAWSPTGRYLAAAIQHGTIFLYSVLPSSQGSNFPPLRPIPFRTFRGHSADVLHLTFSPTHFLASASMDRSVRLWHPNSTECLRNLPHPDMTTSVAFNPADENALLTAGCDGRARVWHLAQHAVVAQADAGAVLTTAVFLSSHRAAVGTYGGLVLGWQPWGNNSGDNSRCSTELFSDILDTRHPQQRKSRRERLRSVRLTSSVVHNNDSRKRRTFFTADVGRAFELRDYCVARRFKTSSLKKYGTALGTSVSSDGRFVMMGAVGGVVQVMDCFEAHIPKKMNKEAPTGTLEMEVMSGANVSSAMIACETVQRRCGRGRRIGAAIMMAVGADDGTLKIVEQPVPFL